MSVDTVLDNSHGYEGPASPESPMERGAEKHRDKVNSLSFQ